VCSKGTEMGAVGVIYLIEMVGHNAVKVGYANSIQGVSDRLKTLQVGNPSELKLLATREGGQDLERSLHREWRLYRIRGERFTRDVVALFDGAGGSSALAVRCIDCGEVRKIGRHRRRLSGRCRACQGKHQSISTVRRCALCGASGAAPYNNSSAYDLLLCPLHKAEEKARRLEVRRMRQSIAMQGNTNAIGRSARGKVLAAPTLAV
jgi:hypothetical protein